MYVCKKKIIKIKRMRTTIRRKTRNNGTFEHAHVIQEDEKIYDLENTVGHCC